MNEEELIVKYRETKKDIYFLSILEKYKPLINKIISRNKYKHSHKEDLWQESYLVLLEAINTYDLGSSFGFYNHLRFRLLSFVNTFTLKEDKYISIEDVPEQVKVKTIKPKTRIIDDIIYDFVKTNKLNLPKKVINILRLYYIEGYTFAEIAKAYNCSFETIRLIKDKAIFDIIEFYDKQID